MGAVLSYWLALGISLCCSHGVAQALPPESASFLIGRVIIVGNTITRDDVIRDAVSLFAAQFAKAADVREAQQRLRKRGIFEMDPAKGMRPTVWAIPTQDPQFRDVLIRVQETVTGTFKFGAGVTGDGRLWLHFQLEERNFDPSCLPTSWEDLEEGRVFRGGGRHLRIGITLIPGRQSKR